MSDAFYDPSTDQTAASTTDAAQTTTAAPATASTTDTATTAPAAAPASATPDTSSTAQAALTGYTPGMSASDYASWYQSMTSAGYSAAQINAYKSSAVGSSFTAGTTTTPGATPAGGIQGEISPYGTSATGYVGGDQGSSNTVAGWNPGQTYTGNGDTPLTGTGETFTPDNSTVDAAPNTSPTMWNVTADQTVQGQMDQITQNMSTNPVYQSLASSLERVEASHGGENSLMAESAAYNQVIGLAYNIASADAATYAKSAEFNASTANQFSLSNRQFMQQALLSTQNYQQSQVLQQQQIQGNLQSVSMQIAGQLRATEIGANAQIGAATIGARAQVQSASISASGQLGAARINQSTALQSIQANFESQWTLNEQQQGHALELNDRQTDNSIRSNIVQSNSNFGQAVTLQHNADQNANLRQLMGSVTTIGSTPGLTGEQQANAITQVTDMYKTNSDLTSSFYSSATHGLSTGQTGQNIVNGSNAAPPSSAMPGGQQTTYGPSSISSGTPGGPVGSTPSYDQYGDYLSYGQGGYTMVAPPVDPFYGGSGLPTSQGGIPLYGSNLSYEQSTGGTVGYTNQLTGTNPLGNAPGQTTGGGNYTGATPFYTPQDAVPGGP